MTKPFNLSRIVLLSRFNIFHTVNIHRRPFECLRLYLRSAPLRLICADNLVRIVSSSLLSVEWGKCDQSADVNSLLPWRYRIHDGVLRVTKLINRVRRVRRRINIISVDYRQCYYYTLLRRSLAEIVTRTTRTHIRYFYLVTVVGYRNASVLHIVNYSPWWTYKFEWDTVSVRVHCHREIHNLAVLETRIQQSVYYIWVSAEFPCVQKQTEIYMKKQHEMVYFRNYINDNISVYRF